MPSITPIPSSRVSSALVRDRLLKQIQTETVGLFQLQQQIATGKRFQLPSEDAPAATRAISLQRLLERKDQVRSNLITNRSFLSASDSAISSVSSILNSVRGTAISVASTVVGSEARAAAAEEVQRAIDQLVDTGNQQFRGRYLFGGSSNVTPFTLRDNNVVYQGNDVTLQSFADIDLLFDTNISGDAIFGAISDSVQSTVDLNPVLTRETLLTDLNGGQGIRPGAITISNGTASSTIDTSGVSTIGDIARLLERNPPAGSKVTAYVTSQGLNIELDTGNLSVREVAGGTTAAELGIRTDVGVGTGPIVGQDLDPKLRLTTPVGNILGARSTARLESTQANSTVLLQANVAGAQVNGVSVQLVDGGVHGAEVTTYDPDAGTLVVQIASGLTRAEDVVASINASAAADTFTASLAGGQDGSGFVDEITATTAGGSGTSLDLNAGLQIVNGANTHIVRFTTAKTVEDVLNTLNGSGAGVVARINAAGTGIDIRSRVSGSDFSIGENGGTTASQLGVRTLTDGTRLEDLNFGRGVLTAADAYGDNLQPGEVAGPDVIITRKDGTELAIDLTAGNQARTTLDPAGANNALRIIARDSGTLGNQYSVQIVDGGPGSDPSASLNNGRLTIRADLAAGFTANDAVELIAANNSLSQIFDVSLDTLADPGNIGTGLLSAAAPVALTGGQGPAQTLGDVINLINNHVDNTGATPLTARLAAFGNGIELVDDNPSGGGVLKIQRTTLSQAAEDLGLLGFQQSEVVAGNNATAATLTVNGADANDALQLTTKLQGAGGNEFRFQINDNGGGPNAVTLNGNVLSFDVDLGSGFTAQDAIDLLQADSSLNDLFSIELDTTADPDNDGSGSLVATGPTSFANGTSESILGTDVHARETEGVFTALVRLRDALLSDDERGVTRAIELLDQASSDLNFARAELGARQQSLDVLELRLDNEQVELTSTLSLEIDVDLVEAISSLTARQASFQASLQTMAQTTQLSLLDFL